MAKGKSKGMPACWQLAEAVLSLTDCPEAQNICLHGALPATGKSYAVQTMGVAAHDAVVNMTLHPDADSIALLGHFILADGGVYKFHEGPWLRPFKNGGVLCVHEADRGGEEALSLMYALADSLASARVTLLNGQTVSRHPRFRFRITTNADPRGFLPEAVYSRFLHIEIDKVHPAALALLPANLQEPAQELAECDDAERRIPLRAWLRYAALTNAGMDMDTACRAVFGPARGREIGDAIKIAAKVGG